jgi:Arc/MetJ-type ribon-helix-helix transcriptional regulator
MSGRRAARRKIKQDPHTERVVALFSESEVEIIDRYVKRRHYRSRSAFVRQCVMERIVGEAGRNRPSLFERRDEEEILR